MYAEDLTAKEVGLSDGLNAETETTIARNEMKNEIGERECIMVRWRF